MKNKTLLFVFCIISVSISSYGQEDKLQYANALKQDNNFKEAIAIYHKLRLDSAERNKSIYNLACCHSLLNNKDSAFFYLEKTISNGAKSKDIFTDTDFLNLYNDPRWTKTKDKLIVRYLANYPEITNKKLSVEMWLMSIEDQRFRTLKKNYKLDKKPKLQKKFKIQSQEFRSEQIKKIIKENGWPTYSMVGKEAAEFAFLALQHGLPKKLKKYLPKIIEAANKNEASWKNAAMMIDRYLAWRKKCQIYGTQFHREVTTVNGELKFGKYKFYPIADEENLEERRKLIGLSTMSEYCKKFGINYVHPSKRKDYEHRKMKKSWIRKGYIKGIN